MVSLFLDLGDFKKDINFEFSTPLLHIINMDIIYINLYSKFKSFKHSFFIPNTDSNRRIILSKYKISPTAVNQTLWPATNELRANTRASAKQGSRVTVSCIESNYLEHFLRYPSEFWSFSSVLH